MEHSELKDINHLKSRLTGSDIDFSSWGLNGTKTLGQLQVEIESGETVLEEGGNGELLRVVTVCGANVYYNSPDGKKYLLVEEKQIFKDGSTRERKLESSVSEKIKQDENPDEAMIRGIKEELGIEGEISLSKRGVDEKIGNSPSYPGLNSKFIIHKFDIYLNGEQFVSSGYVEQQQDKSTYFIWKQV